MVARQYADTPTPHERPSDETSIRALEAAYDAAWQDGNVEALLECFTEDAVVVNPRGQIARGRAEIVRMLQAFLKGPAKGSKHMSGVLRVEFITEDVAIVDGQAVLDDLSPTDPSSPSSLTHAFTDVVVRRNDAWAIAHVRAYDVSDESGFDAR